MPIYEYCCEECRQVFEEWQSGFDEKELECPVCGGVSRRVISNTSFVLKGGGWYATEYGTKSGSGNGDEASAKTDDSSGSEASGSDAAPASPCASGSCPGQASSGSE